MVQVQRNGHTRNSRVGFQLEPIENMALTLIIFEDEI